MAGMPLRVNSSHDEGSADPAIKKIALLCDMHGVPCGATSDLAGFMQGLDRNKHLAMDFWSVVASFSDHVGAGVPLEAINGRILELTVTAVTGHSVAEMIAAGSVQRRLVGDLGGLLAGEDIHLHDQAPADVEPPPAAQPDLTALDVEKLRADMENLKAAFEARFGAAPASKFPPSRTSIDPGQAPTAPPPSARPRSMTPAAPPAPLPHRGQVFSMLAPSEEDALPLKPASLPPARMASPVAPQPPEAPLREQIFEQIVVEPMPSPPREPVIPLAAKPAAEIAPLKTAPAMATPAAAPPPTPPVQAVVSPPSVGSAKAEAVPTQPAAVPAQALPNAVLRDLPLRVHHESELDDGSQDDSLLESAPFIFAPDLFVPPPTRAPAAPAATTPIPPPPARQTTAAAPLNAAHLNPVLPPKQSAPPAIDLAVLSVPAIRSMFAEHASQEQSEPWKPRRRLPIILGIAALLLLSGGTTFYIMEHSGIMDRFARPAFDTTSASGPEGATNSAATTPPTEATPAPTVTKPNRVAPNLFRTQTSNQPINPTLPRQIAERTSQPVAEIDQGLHTPAKIPHDDGTAKQPDAPPTIATSLAAMGGANSAARTAIAGIPNTAPKVHTAPNVTLAPDGTFLISSGVMAGAKISGPEPQYPVWARNARISGEVILRATISKTGTVKDLAVVSGPPGLRESALDAVGQWRYRPFLLNGKPIDVQTLVTVKFSLGYGH